ncbi:MAG: hypothetical protein AB1918_07870 [Pseudomonadota bacterium]
MSPKVSVIVKSPIKAGGKRRPPGEEMDLPAGDAEALLRLGAVEIVGPAEDAEGGERSLDEAALASIDPDLVAMTGGTPAAGGGSSSDGGSAAGDAPVADPAAPAPAAKPARKAAPKKKGGANG